MKKILLLMILLTITSCSKKKPYEPITYEICDAELLSPQGTITDTIFDVWKYTGTSLIDTFNVIHTIPEGWEARRIDCDVL